MMALINEKKIEIGKLVIVWDWFEATKWLSFLNGVLFAFGLTTILLVEYGVVRMKGLAYSTVVICFVLIWIVGRAVNLIREDSLR